METSLINWKNKENYFFLNTKLNKKDTLFFKDAYQDFINKTNLTSHIFILSSGTSGTAKIMALSKKAFLLSTKNVIEHIAMKANTTCLNPLPVHHVGGLSVYARAHLLNQKVVNLPIWNPDTFQQKIRGKQYSSLVPSQVYDLVKNNITAPTGILAIFVGGASLDRSLYQQAYKLGWPLLPTYGASEFCSQIATQNVVGSKNITLKLLPHVQAKTTSKQQLLIKTESLFTCYYNPDNKSVTKAKVDQEGYFATSDYAKIQHDEIILFGRESDRVKILGELVFIPNIEAKIDLNKNNFSILALPDSRKGGQLCLVTSEKTKNKVLSAIETYNKTALGFERINLFCMATNLARNEMGKIKKEKIKTDILQGNLDIISVS